MGRLEAAWSLLTPAAFPVPVPACPGLQKGLCSFHAYALPFPGEGPGLAGSWVRECPLSLPGACTEASSLRAAGSFAPPEVSGGGTALPLCISPKVAATLPGGYKAFRQAVVSQGLSLVVWHGLGPPNACGSAREGCHGPRSSSCSSGGHLRVWGGRSHGATWSPWPGS